MCKLINRCCFKKTLFICTLLLIAFHGICQQQKIDSLKSVLPSLNNDSLKSVFYNNLSTLYLEVNPDSSFKYAELAFLITQKEGITHAIALSCYNMGLALRQQGYLDKALEQYFKSFECYKNIGLQNELSSVLNAIGIVYNYKQDYDNAVNYFKKSIEHTVTGDPSISSTLSNLGVIYQQMEQYDKAMYYLFRSLQLERQINDTISIAGSLINIGNIFYRKKDLDSALVLYHEAVNIMIPHIGEMHPNIAVIYSNIGTVYHEKNDFKNAIVFTEKAMQITKTIYGNYNLLLGDICSVIIEVMYSQKDYIKALEYCQLAFRAVVKDYIIKDNFTNPPLRLINSEPLLFDILKRKAEILESYALQNNYNPEYLVYSFNTYLHLFDLVDKMRIGYNTQSAQFALGSNVKIIYEKAIEMALQLYQIYKDDNYKFIAFELAEKSKASTLLNAMIEADAKKLGNIPDSLIKYEENIKENLVRSEKEILNEESKGAKADSVMLNITKNNLFEWNLKYETFLNSLEKNYSEYYKLKYNLHRVTINDMQKKLLTPKSLLIEYFLGDSSLFIFCVTKDSFKIINTVVDSQLSGYIENMRQGIYKKRFHLFAFYSDIVYQSVLKPAINSFGYNKPTKLTIVPDGILNYLPFETLLTEDVDTDKESPYQKLPYLINNFELSYGYSATLLLEQMKRNASHTENICAVAPVMFYNSDKQEDQIKLLTLPQTEKEVAEIIKLFPNKNKLLLKQAATEQGFKKLSLENFSYIHIATHGIINEENPALSGIVLSNNPDTNIEDGIIYSGEIYNLSLNANLVVLSACETGLGKIVHGEGVIGLTRGFLYAGAKNLIVSLWKVADASTTEFMINFYKELTSNHNNSRSLRNAKIHMIKSNEYALPYYWAPFILIGN